MWLKKGMWHPAFIMTQCVAFRVYCNLTCMFYDDHIMFTCDPLRFPKNHDIYGFLLLKLLFMNILLLISSKALEWLSDLQSTRWPRGVFFCQMSSGDSTPLPFHNYSWDHYDNQTLTPTSMPKHYHHKIQGFIINYTNHCTLMHNIDTQQSYQVCPKSLWSLCWYRKCEVSNN